MSEPTFSAEQLAQLSVTRGAPDDLELAALVASMAVLASSVETDSASPTSAWMDRSRSMRGQRMGLPLAKGEDAWKHSLR